MVSLEAIGGSYQATISQLYFVRNSLCLLTGGPVGLMSRAKLVRWKHWHTVMF